MNSLGWLESLWEDFRLAMRKLVRTPSFTLVAVLTLALGIGANTAIFSIVYAVLIRPLPFEDPGRLVMIWETWAIRGENRVVDLVLRERREARLHLHPRRRTPKARRS